MEARNFNSSLNAKLIEMVRARPVLYRISDPNYNDAYFKDQAWTEISNDVGKTVSDCKTRWRTIRDSYKKNKRKQKFGSKSKYNDRKLKFLDASFRQPTQDLVEVNIPPKKPKICRQIKKDKLPEAKDGLNLKRENMVPNTIPVENPEHPIQTFFKSMASTVMTFPSYLIAETRLKVCNMVTEMELRAIAEMSQQALASPYLISEGSAGAASSSSSASSSPGGANVNQEYDEIQDKKDPIAYE